jgi:chromate transporter
MAETARIMDGGRVAVTAGGEPAPSVLTLFLAFAGVGFMGFGGVIAIARLMIVERRRWLDAGEFSDLLSLCQFLPGGNVLNLSTAIGLRFQGAPGALAAVSGLMGGPVIVVLLMGVIYDRYRDLPLVRGLFFGLSAAAAGLIVAMALILARPLRGRPFGIAIAATCFVAIAWLRLPLIEVMLSMAPLGMLLAWRGRA